MHRIVKKSLTSAALLLLTSGMAWADGTALLPTDADKTNLPNLGLTPSDMPPPAPTPVPQPVAPEAPAKPILAPPQTIAAPTNAPVALQPSTFFLMVFLTKPVYWTANDVSVIGAQLGLRPDDVNRLCSMGFSGTLATTTGSYNFDSQMTQAARVNFQGYIGKTVVTVYASCTMPQKPGLLALLQRNTKNYIVALTGANCEPPRTNLTLHNIAITHMQDGQDICGYNP